METSADRITREAAKLERAEELIDEASEDSFPASDPPSAGPITGIGHESTSTDE